MRAALETTYREMKARDSGLILLFRRGGFYAALNEDATEIDALLADKQFPLWHTQDGWLVQFGAARLKEVLAVVLAAGRRAAVLEQVAKAPKGAEVEMNKARAFNTGARGYEHDRPARRRELAGGFVRQRERSLTMPRAGTIPPRAGHDAADAVGLGLYYLGKMREQELIQQSEPPMLVTAAAAPDNSPAANRQYLQSLIDRAARTGDGVLGILGDTWEIDGPLFLDRSGGNFARLSVMGSGAGTSVVRMAHGLAYDVFAVGIDRRPRAPSHPDGLALSPDHFAPTDGLLDASAAGRWAYRTRADSHLAAQGTALDQGRGDWYGSVRQLTIDAAISLPADSPWADAALFGLADGNDARPWCVRIVNGYFYLVLTTCGPDPSDPESVTTRRLYLGPALTPGLHRLTIQVDLATPGMFVAWVDGQAAAVTQQQGPPRAAGESFAANQHSCFGVGSHAASAGGVTDGFGSCRDVTIAGMKVTASPLYDPAKATPARLDGRPLDDLLRYFSDEPLLVGYLDLSRSPSDVASDRIVRVTQRTGPYMGPTAAAAYCLDNALHGSTWQGVQGGIISGLTISCGVPGGGRGIVAGAVNGLDVRDCTIDGGSHAVSAGVLSACYPLRIRDCRLRGADSPLWMMISSQATVERVVCDTLYRAGVRAVGSGLAVRDSFFSHWGSPDYGFCCRASSVQLRNISLDCEDPHGGSRVADVYVTPVPGQPVSLCEVDTFDGVYSGPGSSKVLLGGPAAGSNDRAQVGACIARVRNLAVHPNVPFRSAVRVLPSASGLWQDGGVEAPLARPGTPTFVAYEGTPMPKVGTAT